MIILGLLMLLLIVFITSSWSGYNFGYRAGTLSEIQRHVQKNHKG